jgi:hypothetical protein
MLAVVNNSSSHSPLQPPTVHSKHSLGVPGQTYYLQPANASSASVAAGVSLLLLLLLLLTVHASPDQQPRATTLFTENYYRSVQLRAAGITAPLMSGLALD